MFLVCSLYYIIIIKYYWGMQYCFRFPTKNGNCAYFFGSGPRLFFHQKTYPFISAKSLFTSRAEVFLSLIPEKKDVLSASSVTFEDSPFDKSLIYIKTIIDQVFNPTLISDHSGVYTFNKTLCFLFLRKSHKRFSKLPDISLLFNVKIGSSCQTLSSAFAFDLSRSLQV